MCILFLHSNISPVKNKFRLILLSNRDEYYKRPASHIHYWPDDDSIVGGKDLEYGKEGGTWLALSKKGKIGILLNLMSSEKQKEGKKSRGNLVSDFVKGSQSGLEYLTAVAEVASMYSPFNLITIEISSQVISVWQLSSINPKPELVQQSYFGASNSPFDKPLKKVQEGLVRFTTIVEKYGYLNTKEHLVDQLLLLLKWDECHFPDQQLKDMSNNMPPNELINYSSVFVKHVKKGYGTRAHNIILIDNDGNTDFIEITLDDDQTHWSKHHLSMTMHKGN